MTAPGRVRVGAFWAAAVTCPVTEAAGSAARSTAEWALLAAALACGAVRTRTLLLLAVVCGLAILVAGVVQLLRVANQDEIQSAAIGESVRVGDMQIVVDDVSERDGRVLVHVELGGVDDDDGADGFSLIVSSGALVPDPTAGNHCGATTTRVEPCTLAFRLDANSGSSRVLVYRRGDQPVSWDLASS